MPNSYAPYFHNGKLFLPHKTLNLLLSAGLDSNLAEQARQGLALDDRSMKLACHLVGRENDGNKLCLHIKWVQSRD